MGPPESTFWSSRVTWVTYNRHIRETGRGSPPWMASAAFHFLPKIYLLSLQRRLASHLYFSFRGHQRQKFPYFTEHQSLCWKALPVTKHQEPVFLLTPVPHQLFGAYPLILFRTVRWLDQICSKLPSNSYRIQSSVDLSWINQSMLNLPAHVSRRCPETSHKVSVQHFHLFPCPESQQRPFFYWRYLMIAFVGKAGLALEKWLRFPPQDCQWMQKNNFNVDD